MNFFDVIFQFFWDSLSGVAFLWELLISMLENIPDYLLWLPPTVSSVVVIGVIIAILFQVLGR